MHPLLHLLALVRALSRDHARLALENLVLRQRLNVLRRSVKRPRLDDSDRVFWGLMCDLRASWKEHLVIVKPETVIRSHRQGFRYYRRSEVRRKRTRLRTPSRISSGLNLLPPVAS